ncbi:hypothetical protein SEA_NOSHOW_71 [Mycobacterium phage NoShow]|nr:hypothetical protein SEA_NOSHOW_71 [Mycobacterium phage NoShow]
MRRKSKEKREVEADAIGYMPERFIAGYYELVRLGLATDPHGQQFDNEASAPKKKYHTHAGGLRDEAALRFKAWVDRQLRAIGRDVQAYLNARDGRGPSPVGMDDAQRRAIARELEQQIELKCHGCGQYVSWQWTFCAWCGRKVEGGKKVSGQKSGRDGGQGNSTGQPEAAADRQPESSGGAGDDVARADGAAPAGND